MLTRIAPSHRLSNVILVCSVWVGLALALPTEALADLTSQRFTVIPPLPSTYEPTALLMEGVSTDACVPRLAGVSRNGNDFTVTLYRSLVPGERCAAVITDWRDSVDLGVLDDGDYSVTVDLRPFPPPYPSSGELFGPFHFTATDRVGVVSHGIVTSRTVCRNRRTREKVVIRGAASVANCEAEGLAVGAGDRIVIRTFGRVP